MNETNTVTRWWYGILFLIALLVVIVFAYLYHAKFKADKNCFCVHGRPAGEIADSLHIRVPVRTREFGYYSLGVFTTTGFSDLSPNSESVRMMAVVETLFGVAVFVFLISILSVRAGQEGRLRDRRHTPPETPAG